MKDKILDELIVAIKERIEKAYQELDRDELITLFHGLSDMVERISDYLEVLEDV